MESRGHQGNLPADGVTNDTVLLHPVLVLQLVPDRPNLLGLDTVVVPRRIERVDVEPDDNLINL